MSVKGIDISKWQGDPDFSKVKSSTGFVIAKATEGYGYTDPKFKRNQSELRRLDIPRGYYHYARPDLNNSPEKEANWFLDTVGGLQKGELLALDAEAPAYKGDWAAWSFKFLEEIRKQIGYKPLVYINKSFNDRFDWSAVVKGNYGFMVSFLGQQSYS